MQIHSSPEDRRRRARSSQQETGFLGIVSPSVATAKDYYQHLCTHHDGEVRDDSSLRSSKVRAIAVEGQPRRHSSPVQHAYGTRDGMEEEKGMEMQDEEKVLTGGKRKTRDFLLSSPPASQPQPISTSLSSPTPPSPSTTVTSNEPPTPLHAPITTTPVTIVPPSSKIHNPLHPQALGNIPFEYTVRKLHDWGMVYLYNTATADVFVRAVPLIAPGALGVGGEKVSAPGMGVQIEEDEDEDGDGDGDGDGDEEGERGRARYKSGIEEEVRRIRVSLERIDVRDDLEQGDSVPGMPVGSDQTLVQGNERKEEVKFFSPLRLPPLQPPTGRGESRGIGCMCNIKIRIRIIPSFINTPSSQPCPLRHPISIEKSFPIRTSLLHLPQLSTSLTSLTSPGPSQPPHHPVPALPFHIEYAAYRAPLLGAILLSGFVHKGDTVEVPLPWPEVWEETLVGVYLGGDGGLAGLKEGDMGRGRERKVRANLEFLGCWNGK